MQFIYKNILMRRTLKLSIWEVIFFSLMVGIGETYFGAFALKLGYGNLKAGLITVLPLAIAGFVQLLTIYGIRIFNSYRKWVVLCVVAQALCYIPYIYATSSKNLSFEIFFIITTLYWSIMLGSNPPWNAWMKRVVPHMIKKRYFSKRGLYQYFATLVGLAAGGIILEFFKEKNLVYAGFAIVFSFAFISRMISAALLIFHWDGNKSQTDLKNLPVLKVDDLLGFITKNELKAIFIPVLIFKLAVYFSAAFFTPYMLSDLKMSYSSYMAILCCSLLGRTIAMSVFENRLKNYSMQYLFVCATIGICIVPIAWTFFPNVLYLMGVEIVSGTFWGIFDLSFFLIVFDKLKSEQQARVLSIFNFWHTFSILFGTILGSYFYKNFQTSLSMSIFHAIFIASGVLRFLSLLSFPGIIMRLKKVSISITTKLVAVRPNIGAIEGPMTVSIRRNIDRLVLHKSDVVENSEIEIKVSSEVEVDGVSK